MLNRKFFVSVCFVVVVVVRSEKRPSYVDGEDDEDHEKEHLLSDLRWHNPWQPVPASTSKLGRYKKAAVASDGGPCSTQGVEVMRDEGGSVVDAAIVTLLCNGFYSIHSMGIGGGFFMTIYNRTSQEVYVVDARETAPSKANKTMFKGRYEASLAGGLAIAVPGEIEGYWRAHQRFGRLPWESLFRRAINLATFGFPLSESAARALKERVAENVTQLESLRPLLYNKEAGRWKVAGETVKNTKLAVTLQKIAKGGAAAFYEGQLAEDISQEIRDNGGILTAVDLKDARRNASEQHREPLVYSLRNGWRIVGPPPPSSTVVVDFIINIFESLYPHFPKKSIRWSQKKTLQFLHRYVEAMKFAGAKRTFLGDSTYVDVADVVANLTSHGYGDEIARMVDGWTHPTKYYGPAGYLDNHGTSHNCFLSPDGDAVSATSTINAYFGSKTLGHLTGIIYNNEMNDFSIPGHHDDYGLEPSPYNWIAPGKKPMSSMAPVIVIDKKGDVRLVVGASGGSKIFTAVASIIRNKLWFGQNIKESIDMPRIHHQLIPRYVEAEKWFPLSLLDDLRDDFGHNVTVNSRRSSIVQGIAVDKYLWKKSITANCDFRKGGSPAGF